MNKNNRSRKQPRHQATTQGQEETFLRKNALAIAALVVSVSLGLWNSYETRRFKAEDKTRWDALNQPHFDVTDTKLVGFTEVDESRAVSGLWAQGYRPIFSQIITTDGVPTNRYVMLSDLVFWDSKTNQRIEGTKPMQTDEDIRAEAHRLGLSNPELRVHYRASFRLRNLGQLAATNAVAKFVVTTDEVRELTSLPRSIAGNNDSFFVVDLYRFLDKPLPEIVSFEISLAYDTEGQRQTTRIKTVIYHAADNRWDWT